MPKYDAVGKSEPTKFSPPPEINAEFKQFLLSMECLMLNDETFGPLALRDAVRGSCVKFRSLQCSEWWMDRGVDQCTPQFYKWLGLVEGCPVWVQEKIDLAHRKFQNDCAKNKIDNLSISNMLSRIVKDMPTTRVDTEV